MSTLKVRHDASRVNESLLTDFDLHLFNEGTHDRLYEKLGAHAGVKAGKRGTFFAVWAPDADGSLWSAIITTGTAMQILCIPRGVPESGRRSSKA
jgi:hypothetical protein